MSYLGLRPVIVLAVVPVHNVGLDLWMQEWTLLYDASHD